MLFFSPDPDFEGAPCVRLSEAEKQPFFSESGNGYKKAQNICRPCPAKAKCLEKALDFERGLDIKHRFGVWGGETVAARARMEKQRRSA